MELYYDILNQYFSKQTHPANPIHDIDPIQLIECQCYQALKQIKAIIEDDHLDDKECFFRIEKIICLLEDVGSNGGNRHDFG